MVERHREIELLISLMRPQSAVRSPQSTVNSHGGDGTIGINPEYSPTFILLPLRALRCVEDDDEDEDEDLDGADPC